ncbi:hypothetical protein [Luteococcus japonicus]|nr:hypothetical protein [Luteococcus japonicus]
MTTPDTPSLVERRPHEQRWFLRLGGRDHVATTSGRITTHVELRRDGELLLHKDTLETRTTLTCDEGSVPGLEADLRRTRTGRVKRVTLRIDGREVDLEPEAGSPAARRLTRERRHPWAYASLDVLVAVVGVLLPLLGIGALIKLLLAPVIAWLLGLLPDWHLPRIPWPDIDWPDIPWPHLDFSWIPDWTPPWWFIWFFDHLGQVKPVLFALVIAVYEVRRRRRQDQEKKDPEALEREELLERLARAMQQVAGGSARAGERDHETGPTHLRPVDTDRSAVGRDDLVDDRQTQP